MHVTHLKSVYSVEPHALQNLDNDQFFFNSQPVQGGATEQQFFDVIPLPKMILEIRGQLSYPGFSFLGEIRASLRYKILSLAFPPCLPTLSTSKHQPQPPQWQTADHAHALPMGPRREDEAAPHAVRKTTKTALETVATNHEAAAEEGQASDGRRSAAPTTKAKAAERD